MFLFYTLPAWGSFLTAGLIELALFCLFQTYKPIWLHVNQLHRIDLTSVYTARWPLRHAALLDNYSLQIITKTKHYRWLNVSHDIVEWADNHFGLDLT